MKKFGSTRVTDAAYHLSSSSVFWFQRKRFLNVFTINGHGGHMGHVTWTMEAPHEIWLQSA